MVESLATRRFFLLLWIWYQLGYICPYKQILASNPNCEPAHVRLAEIYLNRWNGKKNYPDKELGLQHLRRAIELANQDIQSYSDKTPFLKLGAIDHAKKLSQIEQRVLQGVTGLGLDFPQY